MVYEKYDISLPILRLAQAAFESSRSHLDGTLIPLRWDIKIPLRRDIEAKADTNQVLLVDVFSFTGCFLRPDIKRFCLTFTIGPDRIWFCLIPVSDFFLQ